MMCDGKGGGAVRGDGGNRGGDGLDQAVRQAEKAVGAASAGTEEHVLLLVGLAIALMQRAEATARFDDYRAAHDRLEEARSRTSGPRDPVRPVIDGALADVRRFLGDGDGACAAAVEGLRAQVWQVLAHHAQAGLRHAVRDIGADAVHAARICLGHSDSRRAVTALDLGRGAALFAATATGSLEQLLGSSGDLDLLARWRTAVAAGPGNLPAGLRREVLAAASAVDDGASVLDPPGVGEIGDALQAVGADALVYLLPGDGSIIGYAVVVSAAGRAGYIGLPNLSVAAFPVIERYFAAAARRVPSGDDTAADEFAGSLEPLCRWAWDAALRPLVQQYLPGLPPPDRERPRRVVLVPMGDLSRVPWAAARDEKGTYAVESLAITQVASARMLCRTASLAPVPLSRTGLVVADPDLGALSAEPQLRHARAEGYAIQRVFYRGARFLGRRPSGPSPSGAGTATEVLEWLDSDDPAEGTVAHLACHAVVDAVGPKPTAHVVLAAGSSLHAEDLVGRTTAGPGRDIGLVVLSACRSGGSVLGHDEAYSLASALLARGVRAVLCTQWPVSDVVAPPLMFMVHHYLHHDQLPVWEALRLAQLWALDRARSLPDAMPAPLQVQAASAVLARPTAWASVVHWGR